MGGYSSKACELPLRNKKTGRNSRQFVNLLTITLGIRVSASIADTAAPSPNRCQSPSAI
jgi:hypothetical protein